MKFKINCPKCNSIRLIFRRMYIRKKYKTRLIMVCADCFPKEEIMMVVNKVS